MKKIIAISSIGGHWVQLMRLKPAFENNIVIYVTTSDKYESVVGSDLFYSISDGNKSNIPGLIKCFFQIFRIIKIEKPDFIVSTGAAPGLIAIIIGKLYGAKTIWIDSIANCEKLSLSGKISTLFANKVYTQWSHLEKEKVKFKGRVF
jgi:UDP-N-acetylglucosamine:LPS N-acetylglucosamine transferase